jgi:hypothetical protein
MEMEYTKGPWKHEGLGTIMGAWETTFNGQHMHPCRKMIANVDTSWNEGLANAEFIVRACNAHDELVAACEQALDVINSYSHIPAMFKACTTLQHALDRVKGE